MRRPIKKKNVPAPDHLYNSPVLGRFINYIMLDGKKTVAEKIAYDAFKEIEKITKEKPLEVFESAIANVGPTVEIRSRRVGGANYQVPHEVRPERRQALAMRWIRDVMRGKKGVPSYKTLASELIAASKGEGEAMKKKQTTHAMADANKAFAHFATSYKKSKK